jgi:hypothetical protein
MLQPTETVTRPDPGLARGKWEAPAWAFWLALALIAIGTTAYVLRRMGMLRFGSKAGNAEQSGQGKQP